MEEALQKEIFSLVKTAANELDYEVYVVGGYVRDFLLGRVCTDIDFVCVGDGVELARSVSQILTGNPKVSVFKNFGTAHIHHGDFDFEFVGARKESYRNESRKPEVEPGTIEDDQLRRDFTINALAISLNDENYGQLVDPFDGQSHLENKTICTPTDPNITFSDDPLRMMRAIRFACQLEFTIDPITLEGIRTQAERIKIISMERVRDELNKIIASDKPSIGFKLLFECGLLKYVFPEMLALQGVEIRKGVGHKDNFFHTLQVLDNVASKSQDLWLRWGAILHDIAKPRTKDFNDKDGWTFHGHEFVGSKMVKRIFRRFRLPLNEHMKYVEKMVLLHLRPIALTKETVTDSAVRRLLFDAGDDIDDLLLLSRCDITSKNDKKVRHFLKNLDNVEKKIQDVEERDRVRNFQPPVSGEEIMTLFGLKPSREIGIIKNALKEAILEGIIPNNREEALKFAVKKGTAMGLKEVTSI